MTSKKIELLAPAGTWEALEAAVSAGANAVYLGGTKFGARAFAGNFDHEELTRAVTFAHRRNVRIYVTVNTLFSDAETQSLADELTFFYSAGVDALIVQDMGVVRLARRLIPDMPLHASTQMTITNSPGVRFAARAGICRVVPARELTLQAWRSVSSQGVETEAFIHGALCMCYSGQCLMSSMIGGRSGNRGRCAQPCRMAYDVIDERGNTLPFPSRYPLSPRDLNTLPLLPELAEAGVFSFKIEGRMKRPEYVAVVTSAYRRAFDSWLDGHYDVPERDIKGVEQIFNRGFTTAYLKNRPGQRILSGKKPNNRGVKIGRVKSVHAGKAKILLERELHSGDGLEFGGPSQPGTTADHISVNGSVVSAAPAGTVCELPVPRGVQSGNDVFRTLDRTLIESAEKFFGEKNRLRVPVNATVEGAVGEPITVTFEDRSGISGTAKTTVLAEEARTRPLDAKTLRAQLGRLGTTDYRLDRLESRLSGNLIVPVSALNETRRQAIEALDAARLEAFAPRRRPLPKDAVKRLLQSEGEDRERRAVPHNGTSLAVWVDALDKVRAACEGGADWIVFGGDCFDYRAGGFDDYASAVRMCRSSHKKVALCTPRIVAEESVPAFEEFLRAVDEIGPDELRVHSAGLWQLAREVALKTPLWADSSLNIANSQCLAFWAGEGARGATLSYELNASQVRSLARHSPLPLECVVHGPVELMVSEFPLVSCVGRRLSPDKQVYLRDRSGAAFPVRTDQFGKTHILNCKSLCVLELVPRLKEAGIARLKIDARAMSPSETRHITSLYRDALRGQNVPNLSDTTRGHYSRGAF